MSRLLATLALVPFALVWAGPRPLDSSQLVALADVGAGLVVLVLAHPVANPNIQLSLLRRCPRRRSDCGLCSMAKPMLKTRAAAVGRRAHTAR